jgi:glutamate synthase domain-containing protein 2
VLLELRKNCPEVFDKLEVYIDGGFERGSDILKAIALGATAVGIGRPFLYSLIHGQDGAEHLCHSEFSVSRKDDQANEMQFLRMSLRLRCDFAASRH